GGDLFIYDDDDKIQSLNNSWGLIKAFGTDGNINYTGNTGLKTIVASLNEDGVLTPVDRLSTNTSNKRVIRLIDTGKKVPTSTKLLGDAYSTSTTSGTAYNVNGTTDVTNGAKVEVRALNSTVYYYVYPSSSSRGNPIVREYTGYNRLPELKESEIEDVYTVGTMVNRDVTGENRTYFTANVVVVEVAGTYKGGAEEVLVVDTPVVGNGVTEDTLLVIRANGAMEEIQVDLSASKGVKTIEQSGMGSYGPAGTNKVMPGLYKIYETDKSGVYEIAPMSHADIRDSGRYAVGQVSTSEYTSIDQYVEVAGFTYASDTDNDLNNTKTSTRIVKDITDSSKLYTLSYKGWNADLKDQTDWAEYMSEAVDRVNDSTGLNREFDVKDRNNEDTRVNANFNDVLIRYDKGNIVYAVSFANLISSREETTLANTNNAQRVWNNVKPDPKGVAGAPTLKFYGNDVNLVSGEFTLTGANAVTYQDAKNFTGLYSLDVGNGDIVIPKNMQQPVANVDGVTYEGTILGDDGEYYKFKLEQKAASGNNKLANWEDPANPVEIVDANGDTAWDNFVFPNDNAPWRISDFVERYRPMDVNATATYKFTTNSLKEVVVTYDPSEKDPWNLGEAEKNMTTADVAIVLVTVHSEDGKSHNSYELKKANTTVVDWLEEWNKVGYGITGDFYLMKSGDQSGDVQLVDMRVDETGKTIAKVLTEGASAIDKAATQAAKEQAYKDAYDALVKAVEDAIRFRLDEIMGKSGQTTADGKDIYNNWCATLHKRFDATLDALATAKTTTASKTRDEKIVALINAFNGNNDATGNVGASALVRHYDAGKILDGNWTCPGGDDEYKTGCNHTNHQ
ncbi:MAG: hypothetical protein HFF18_10660, partial [Oscillospiraceae bacterium]|nr:hypothetical protein [Oscillospiraceae bacterium]